MKKAKIIFFTLSSLVTLYFLIAFLELSKPRRISYVQGSITLHQASFGRNGVVIIEGSDPISMGQIQGSGIEFIGHKIFVQQYAIVWNPLSELSVHQEWPIVIFKDALDPGFYEVYYWNRARGYISAGKFTVSKQH
jgi:hypothetical protein